MKKIIGAFLLLISTNSLACDVCGCSAGAFTQGMLNTGRSTIFGLRSTHRWFQSFDPADATRSSFTSENYNAVELFGRINIGKRFQTGIFVPYILNRQTVSSNYTKLIHGIGDVVVLQDFIFVNTIDSLDVRTRLFGTVGLGLKIPTGKHIDLTWPERTMMPGTGSFDVNAHTNFLVQFDNKLGLQNEIAFTYKTENKEGFRFGHSLSASQVLYYQAKINDNWKIVPQIGLNYLWNGSDRENGKINPDSYSGGTTLNGICNLNIFYKYWTLNIQTFIPIYQNLSKGYVEQKVALRTGILYTLKTKKNEKK